jgi:hypothetical protein
MYFKPTSGRANRKWLVQALRSRRYHQWRPLTTFGVCYLHDGICPACGRFSCWEDSEYCERKDMERLLLKEKKIYAIQHVAKMLALQKCNNAKRFLQRYMPTQVYTSRWLFSMRPHGFSDHIYVYKKDLLDCLERNPAVVLKAQARFQLNFEKREREALAEKATSGFKHSFGIGLPNMVSKVNGDMADLREQQWFAERDAEMQRDEEAPDGADGGSP